MTDSLPFTPVPTASTRRDGWTPDKQRHFISQLARCGLVSAAARAVGMSPKSAYALLKRPGADSFVAAWDAAVRTGRAGALALAIDRAVDGVVRPVFYRGKQVGEYRTYNDRLLVAAIRAVHPDADALPSDWEDAQHEVRPRSGRRSPPDVPLPSLPSGDPARPTWSRSGPVPPFQR